jgi:hypothetical protein
VFIRPGFVYGHHAADSFSEEIKIFGVYATESLLDQHFWQAVGSELALNRDGASARFVLLASVAPRSTSRNCCFIVLSPLQTRQNQLSRPNWQTRYAPVILCLGWSFNLLLSGSVPCSVSAPSAHVELQNLTFVRSLDRFVELSKVRLLALH